MDGIFEDRKDDFLDHLHDYQHCKLMMNLSDNIFHDFKNILANISGLTQLSLIETEAKKLKTNLKDIYEATFDFKEALNRYQQLMKGPLGDEKEIIRVEDILRNSLGTVEYRFSNNNLGNIKLVTDLRSNSKILSNCYELNHAFINIIINALDAMEENGGTLAISIYNIEDTICIRFKDTGVGISEDNLNKIFQRFYTSKPHGSGLGLTLAKETIEDHGGTINVKSRINYGSEVNITLPIFKDN